MTNTKKTTKKGRATTTKKVPDNIKTYVKRAITADVEDKNITFYQGNRSSGNFNSNQFINQCLPLIPWSGSGGNFTIAQGTDTNQRVGNKIKIKKMELCISATPAEWQSIPNPSPTPTDIYFWIVVNKADRSNPCVPTVNMSSFYNGSSSTSSTNTFNGTVQDWYRSINKNGFIVKKKFKMKIGYATSGGTGNLVAYQSFTNNDYKFQSDIKIDVTKYIGKIMEFDTAGDTKANSDVVTLVWEAVNANGTSDSNGGNIKALVTTVLNCTYEDA